MQVACPFLISLIDSSFNSQRAAFSLFGLLFSAAFVFSPHSPGRRGALDPATSPCVVPPDEFVFQTPAGQILTEDEIERRGPPPVR